MAKRTLKSCDVNTVRFLKYIGRFFNIMHDRIKISLCPAIELVKNRVYGIVNNFVSPIQAFYSFFFAHSFLIKIKSRKAWLKFSEMQQTKLSNCQLDTF